MTDSQTYMRSLGELRNNALLLVVANAHLCEESYIVKIGENICKNAQLLKDDITALRKEYPGKFVKEVETDSLIDKINETAQSMLQPSEGLMEKCEQGKLGDQLESDINSIAGAIKEIKGQVEGKGSASKQKISSADLSSHLVSAWDSIGSIVTMGLKVFLCIFILAALAFGYLFFTLDSESQITKTISSSKAQIQGQMEIINELESEKARLIDETKMIESKDLLRKEKIKILDIEVKIHGIDDKIRAAHDEIEKYNEKIAQNNAKLEEIARKTFIERLLRR